MADLTNPGSARVAGRTGLQAGDEFNRLDAMAEEAFLTEGSKVQGPVFLDVPAPTNEVTSERELGILSETYAVALGRDAEEVRGELDTGGKPLLDLDLRGRLSANNRQADEQLVQRLIEGGKDPEEARIEAQVRATIMGGLAPDVAVMVSGNPDVSPISARYIERDAAARRMVADKLEQSTGGFLAGTGYFLDMAASQGVHSVFGAIDEALGLETNDIGTMGAGQLIDLAKEASQLMHSDISDAEFEQRFTEILDRVADAGFFSEENWWFLANFIDMVDEQGVGTASSTERAFQGLDIVLAPLAVKETLELARGVRLGSRLGETARNVAQVGSREAATNMVVRNAERGTGEDIVAEGTSPSLVAPGRTSPNTFTGPELHTLRTLETQNTVLRIVRENNWGQVIPQSVLEAKLPVLLDDLKVRVANWGARALDYAVRIDPNTQRLIGEVYLGKAGNQGGFLSEAAARKLADQVGGAEVRAQVSDGTTKYVVRKDFDISTAGLADPTDLSAVMTAFAAKAMSTSSRTTFALDAMLKRGESLTAKALRDVVRNYRKAVKKTTPDEISKVDMIFSQVRDDPNFSSRWEAYTEADFKRHYFTSFGNPAPKETVDFFKMVRDMSDTEYFLRAEELVRLAVNNGEEMVQLGGDYFRVKAVSNLPSDTKVFDEVSRKFVTAESAEGKGWRIYEVAGAEYDPGIGRVRYVTGKALPSRRLYASDVLPYNMGGHRIYEDTLKFFIKQDQSDIKLADGSSYSSNPNTFMAVRTEKEAKEAVDQWNAIVEAVRAERNVDEVIQANNAWNPSIENLEDLTKFAEERGLDITKRVDYAGDGFKLPDQRFSGASDIKDYFIKGFGGRRGNRPLVGFGGDNLSTVSPLSAIQRTFASSVARKGDQRYMHNAINGWVQAGKSAKAFDNWTEIKDLPIGQMLRQAKIDTNTAVGRALEMEKFTILHRMNNYDSATQAYNKLMDSIATFVHENVGKSLGKPLDTLAQKDPAGFLRSIAFNTKLGMFAVDQLYVQASQLVTIMGAGTVSLGNPLSVVRAFSAIVPMRIALIDQVSEPTLRYIAKLQAPISGISEQGFIDTVKWFKQSGRNIVSRTAVEENNSYARIGGRLDKTLEYGQVFFNEGELMARMGAALVNYKEVSRKAPDINIFDDAITDAMIARQDRLTASMTSASSAPWQKDLRAVPFQFSTYMIRMYETLFTSHFFKPSERLGIAGAHVLTYGGATAPFVGYAMDRMAYDQDSNVINSEVRDALRWGLLDAALEAITGTETTLSARLGVGEGTTDFFKNLFSGNLEEVLTGPSGAITGSILNDSFVLLQNMYTDQFDYVSYDFTRLARNVTSVDRAYALYMGSLYGEYYNRKNLDTTLDNMTSPEVLLTALGVPLEERRALWTAIESNQRDDRDIYKTLQLIRRLDNIRADQYNSGDKAGALETTRDITAILQLLPIGRREEVMRRMSTEMTLPQIVIRDLLENGRTEAAERIRELTQ